MTLDQSSLSIDSLKEVVTNTYKIQQARCASLFDEQIDNQTVSDVMHTRSEL